jgi:hypothetical protein
VARSYTRLKQTLGEKTTDLLKIRGRRPFKKEGCNRYTPPAHYLDWAGLGLEAGLPTGNGTGAALGSIIIAALALAFAVAEPGVTEFGISDMPVDGDWGA